LPGLRRVVSRNAIIEEVDFQLSANAKQASPSIYTKLGTGRKSGNMGIGMAINRVGRTMSSMFYI
jgi:hypothetical protein